MPVVRRLAWLCLLSAGLAGACKSAPPKPPATTAVQEPPPPPAPPPPKSCDTLADECAAAADTRVPIQGSGWSLSPPPEWIYARGPDTLLAKTKGASIAVTVHETGKKKAATAARAKTLEDVTQKLGLTGPKKKLVWPSKPAKSLTVGEAKVALYQFGGFSKDKEPGALLVFTSNLSGTQSLLGVGFVLEKDTHDADKAILACVESIRADGPAEAPDGGASP